jgi:D-arabinose 1-dehydrogenase-like Zn-dependent alcohol dehydrogenase
MAKWDLSKLNNQQANELSTIVITDTVEHPDGSATYTFDMDDASTKKITELGLEFILTCAAYDLDIQDALQVVVNHGKLVEQELIDGPYTAEDKGDTF